MDADLVRRELQITGGVTEEGASEAEAPGKKLPRRD
jgi:hypothetical protein